MKIHEHSAKGFTYSILGIDIYVEGQCSRTVNAVRSYLTAHLISAPATSPDLCVFLAESLEQDRLRYLFRDQPSTAVQNLGAHCFFSGSSSWRHWQSSSPVLVPYSLPILENRFTALHGASLVRPDRKAAIILVGAKGAGKSTVTLGLTKTHGWHLLSDENAVVDNQSLLVHPLVRPIHSHQVGSDGILRKSAMKFSELPWLSVGFPTPPATIYSLSRFAGVGNLSVTKIDSRASGVKLLLAHVLKFGSNTRHISVTLGKLVSMSDVYRVVYGRQEHLAKLIQQISHQEPKHVCA